MISVPVAMESAIFENHFGRTFGNASNPAAFQDHIAPAKNVAPNAMSMILEPIPFVACPVRIEIHPETVSLILSKFSFILGTIRVIHSSHTMFQAFIPMAIVTVAVLQYQTSLSMQYTLAETTIIAASICKFCSTFTMGLKTTVSWTVVFLKVKSKMIQRNVEPS